MPVIDGVLPEMEYGDTSRRPSLKIDGVLQYLKNANLKKNICSNRKLKYKYAILNK